MLLAYPSFNRHQSPPKFNNLHWKQNSRPPFSLKHLRVTLYFDEMRCVQCVVEKFALLLQNFRMLCSLTWGSMSTFHSLRSKSNVLKATEPKQFHVGKLELSSTCWRKQAHFPVYCHIGARHLPARMSMDAFTFFFSVIGMHWSTHNVLGCECSHGDHE